jgi:hypothetical protein
LGSRPCQERCSPQDLAPLKSLGSPDVRSLHIACRILGVLWTIGYSWAVQRLRGVSSKEYELLALLNIIAAGCLVSSDSPEACYMPYPMTVSWPWVTECFAFEVDSTGYAKGGKTKQASEARLLFARIGHRIVSHRSVMAAESAGRSLASFLRCAFRRARLFAHKDKLKLDYCQLPRCLPHRDAHCIRPICVSL